MLASCAFHDPVEMPKTGTYNATIMLVDSDEELRILCGIDYAKACANLSAKPPILMFNRHTMNDYFAHEVKHITNGHFHE